MVWPRRNSETMCAGARERADILHVILMSGDPLLERDAVLPRFRGYCHGRWSLASGQVVREFWEGSSSGRSTDSKRDFFFGVKIWHFLRST